MKFCLKIVLLLIINQSLALAIAITPPKGKINTIEIGAANTILVKMKNHDKTICSSPNYNYYYVIHPDAIYGTGSMDRMLSLLLAAKMAQKDVSFTLNGCTGIGPYIRHIILH